MNIVPRKNRGDFDGFFNDDWFFPVFPKSSFDPEMDLYEPEKDIVAELNLPSVDCDKIDVTVDDGVLRIWGEFENKQEESGRNYWSKEIKKGSFQRAVRIPGDVDEEKVDATYDDGVLKITMPKKEQEKKKERKIKVKKK